MLFAFWWRRASAVRHNGAFVAAVRTKQALAFGRKGRSFHSSVIFPHHLQRVSEAFLEARIELRTFKVMILRAMLLHFYCAH